MKQILILLLFLSSISIAQNDSLEIRIRNNVSGDSVRPYIHNINGYFVAQSPFEADRLTLLHNGKKDLNCWIKTYEMEIISINKHSTMFKSDESTETFTMKMNTFINKANFDTIEKIIFKEILVAIKSGNNLSTRKLAPIIFYIGNINTKSNINSIPYKGKLLMGKDKDTPVQNQKVILKDKSEKEIQSTTTDKYGDFEFTNINTKETYKIVLDATSSKIKDDVVYMAKQDGTIVEVFNKTGSSFTYELLPAELSKLAKVEEVDTELKIRNFSSSKENNLTVIENIYYATNSADINTDSEKKLDKIIKSMQDNKSLKLAIASHTDSKGDDASNMTLSEKRAQKVMEYFISKGITKERLTAKGYGETQILNRCKNGIDCSEMENELNRRTEFKFTK